MSKNEKVSTYIGTKVVNAVPMTRLAYNQLRGWDVPSDENPADDGYLVEYLDGGKANVPGFAGYVSWSPADVFERSYKQVANKFNDDAIEQKTQDNGLNAPRITPADIEANIDNEYYFTAADGLRGSSDGRVGYGNGHPLSLLTFCTLVLNNGFTVTGESACASPENFDAEIGRTIARKNAIDKVWPLMGYMLKQRLHDESIAKQDLHGLTDAERDAVTDKGHDPMMIEVAAELCHEANRAYCKALGDDSQACWGDAPDWQRASAIAGVEFHIANPDAGPSHSHDSWLRQKEADGWKYGPAKDAEKKEHPCFVLYDQLPPEQKAKDYIFSSIVKTIVGINKG